MKSDEIIKEKIRIETERFKVYVLVIAALAGGLYGLLVNFQESNDLTKIVCGVGIFFWFALFIISVNSYISVNNLFKKLEKKEDNNV